MTAEPPTDAERMRWFVAVAEELSFSRAAKSLNVARQRLSAAVIELSNDAGEPLFVPGDGPTELTDAGRELLQRARLAVADDDLRRAEAAAAAPEVPTLRVGFVPGVTVTKWTRIWADRFPDIALDALVVEADEQEAALREARVDVCFVRTPVDREGLSVVSLYTELPVVVVPKDHPVSLFADVTLDDLAGEQIQDTTEAVPTMLEMVAAGVGPVILPHSLARLHSRRDLVFRTVTDAPPTQIALAWRHDGTTEVIEEFLGVVRGRSPRSSRSPRTATQAAPKARKAPPVSKETKPKKKPAPKSRRGRR
ncbi:LysR family transcriptional regulator [Rhodococcoides trifolii]|uniref:LysR family transcriptional regulator n=1 Tax=Rhodococcoides trifolii TaxID=908250 RepID=UPI001E3F9B00|nr:LysR substrate-binding domain-containing protein [Rhodococcus trifolii]